MMGIIRCWQRIGKTPKKAAATDDWKNPERKKKMGWPLDRHARAPLDIEITSINL
jgi:hypothetical protein